MPYVLGARKDDVFLQLKALLAPFGIRRFYTDGWEHTLDTWTRAVITSGNETPKG